MPRLHENRFHCNLPPSFIHSLASLPGGVIIILRENILIWIRLAKDGSYILRGL